MKKWTVMLIPHDRSSTRTLEMSSLHFNVVVGVLVVLAFTVSFLFQRHTVLSSQNGELLQANRSLELQTGRVDTPVVVEQGRIVPASNPVQDAINAAAQEEYTQSIAAITAELNALYEMEAKARNITGLAPRRDGVDKDDANVGDGKGGGLGTANGFIASSIDESLRPDSLIYGMARPSADLIMQEIRLRRASLEAYVADGEAEIDRLARVPSVWPLKANAGKITSRFGYRRHPIYRRVRHHDGTDIAAKTGTVVLATAKGVVREAAYDRYLGHYVKIDHGNGLRTLYAHLSKRLVSTGDVVQRKDEIGKVGSTGMSTGPHLHYEVHKRGKAVDSAEYFTE